MVCSSGKRVNSNSNTRNCSSFRSLHLVWYFMGSVFMLFMCSQSGSLHVNIDTQKHIDTSYRFLMHIYICLCESKCIKKITQCISFTLVMLVKKKLAEYHSECDGSKKQSSRIEPIDAFVVKARSSCICWILIYCRCFVLLMFEYAFHIYSKEKGDANLRNDKLPFSRSLILWSLWCYVFLIPIEFKTQGNLRSLPIIEARWSACLFIQHWFLLFSENYNQRIPIQGRYIYSVVASP